MTVLQVQSLPVLANQHRAIIFFFFCWVFLLYLDLTHSPAVWMDGWPNEVMHNYISFYFGRLVAWTCICGLSWLALTVVDEPCMLQFLPVDNDR